MLQVYRGSLRGMSAVAVKEVNSPDRCHQERFLREIALMRGCYDENIVAFRGAIVGESCTLLVMQCMENGNLYDLLARARANDDSTFRWYGRCFYLHNRDEPSSLSVATYRQSRARAHGL